MQNAIFPNLERFLIENAPPHKAVDDAPQNLAELNMWADHICPDVLAKDRPGTKIFESRLPVWNGASGRTIYSSESVNFAYRAYHDWTHLRLQLDVSLDDEFQVSCAQVDHARAWGLPDIEVRALWADSHGQNAYYKHHGKFVEDQRAFVLAFMAIGDHALTLEW